MPTKFKKLHFGEVTRNLTKTILRNDELFTELRKSIGLTPKQFEFYLDTVEGQRPDDSKDDANCAYCGSAMTDTKGNCGNCGL